MSLLARASLRHLARHPLQLALELAGVALGVSVAVGIELASHSAREAFAWAAETATGRATHRLEAGAGGIDEALYARLRLEGPDVAMAPRVEDWLFVDGTSPRTLRLAGVDPMSEAGLRPWLAARAKGGDPLALLSEPGGVLLAAETARELGLEPGAVLEGSAGGRRVELSLLGLLEPADELTARGVADLAVVDIAAAQEILGRTGRIDAVDLRLDEDPARRAAELAQLERLLGGAARVVPASHRARSLQGMTRAFDMDLRALSLLALLVGVFLVYGATSFSVVQRRELFGALRTLGVTRGQILRQVVAEALALGAVGGAAGALLGWALASSLVERVAATINDLYFAVRVSELEASPAILARGLALGIGAMLAGSLVPAIEGASVAPRTAQQRSQLEARTRRALPALAISGAALCAISPLLVQLPGEHLAPALAALFALLVGFALLAPAATALASRAAAPPLGAVLGSLGRLAARGLEGSLSRSGVAVAALSVAIAAAAGMEILVRSFRGTLERWLEASIQADVYVSAPSEVASRNTGVLAPALVERVLAAPGLAGHTGYRGFETALPDGTLVFAAAISREGGARRTLELAQGDERAAQAAFERGGALVSESLASRLDLRPGAVLTLTTDRGPQGFPVAGVYYDYASDQGFALLERDTYERFWDDRAVSSLGMFTERGGDASALLREVRSRIGAGEVALVHSGAALREATLDVFERTFAITRVLRLLAGGVAFAGTLSALLALALERRREIAVLRAQGLTPLQVRVLVLAQTALMGLVAGIVAIPAAVAVALVLVRVVNRRAFGWTLDFQVDSGLLASAVGLAVASALLAGLSPAWRMARVSPAVALRVE
ncbi:MAG TPA: FtsX-like permease family protein [Planctomycetota bacterium]|nr:FtsX-like permease family protein [Planctomycetota bacterium]